MRTVSAYLALAGAVLIAAEARASDCDLADEPCLPAEIEARDGAKPPRGYQLETRPKWLAVVGGIAASTVGTVVLISGASNAAEAREAPPGTDERGDGLVIGAGALTLAAGVALILWGVLDADEVFVRKAPTRSSTVALENGRTLSVSF